MEDKSISKALIAELIGTFFLVLTIIVAVCVYAGVGGGKLLPNVVIPFVALAHGVVLFIMIQALGAISGGHFNPAVTCGLLSIKKIAPAAAGAYIVVQVIGATLAAFLVAAVLPDQADIVKFGAPAIAPEITLGAGIVLEAIFTFTLVWTIVATAVNPNGPKEWAPLAIGSALALGVLLIGSLTGGSFNPARAFGPDLANAIFGKSGGFGELKDFFLAYVIAPIAGGVLAATLYNALYIKDADSIPASPAPSEQSPL